VLGFLWKSGSVEVTAALKKITVVGSNPKAIQSTDGSNPCPTLSETYVALYRTADSPLLQANTEFHIDEYKRQSML